MKRHTIRYDKNIKRTYSAMRNAVVNLGFETLETDKHIGIVKFTTPRKYVFFGGTQFSITAYTISERSTDVTLSVKDNISKKDFLYMTENIFKRMDKELPVETV